MNHERNHLSWREKVVCLASSMKMISVKMISAVMALAVSGCQLPSAAPTATEIETASAPDWNVYLVKVNPPIVRILASERDTGFPKSLRLSGYTPTVRLRPGDVIGVNIYETGGITLFGAPPQQSPTGLTGQAPPQTTTLPPQIIEPDGQILVPFVGRVSVAGKTPMQAANEIEKGLTAQTVKPQVIVSLLQNGSNEAAVGGEVNKAGLVPLTLRGEKLLDVIAVAGGPKFPATETDVRMIRGHITASIPLQQVLSSPSDNITVQPNDNIVLVRNPKTFVVLGATQKVSQYNFDTAKVTLAEAVARAGGAIDTATNLSAIYLFRYEPTQVARSILETDAEAVDIRYARSGGINALVEPETRMVYRIDLTKSGGYFYAQNIALHDKDIILLTNTESTELSKFLLIVRGLTGVYYDVNRYAR